MVDNLQSSAEKHQKAKYRASWDDTWLAIADTIGHRSLCGRAQVGAVIVDERNRPISMGYNGPPMNFNHEDYYCSAWCSRGNIPNVYQETGVMPDVKYDDCPSLHAEQNALIAADRTTFTGGTIYVNSHICGVCAKLISNSGIKRVVVQDSLDKIKERNSGRWYTFMENLGIQVNLFDQNLLFPEG